MVRMNFIFISSSDPNLLRKKSVKQKIKKDGPTDMVSFKEDNTRYPAMHLFTASQDYICILASCCLQVAHL